MDTGVQLNIELRNLKFDSVLFDRTLDTQSISLQCIQFSGDLNVFPCRWQTVVDYPKWFR